MDILTFLSSLINSVAWPVSAFAISFVLKKPITDLLDRLKSAKHKDTELSFDPKQSTPLKLENSSVLGSSIPQDSLGLISEAKSKILDSLNQLGLHDSEEKIEVLASHHANLQIRSSYSQINLTIYESQFNLLVALNTRAEPVEPDFIISYYTAAKENFPEHYENISFEAWVNYLKTSGLINTESGKFFLTVFGRGFLSALVEAGINQPRLY